MPRNSAKAVLEELLRRTNRSQGELANALHVALPTVNRWLNDKSAPDKRALKAILEYIKKLGPAYGDLVERLQQDEPSINLSLGVAKSRERKKKNQPEPEQAITIGEKATLDVRAMESLLWKAACAIRGEKDAPKFKDYLLPLIFIKRLSDVFEDELVRLEKEFGDRESAESVVDADHSVVRFYIPPEARWPVVNGREVFDWLSEERPKTLGEQLTTTIRRITKTNESLQGVIDIVDFNETRNGEREISDEALRRVIEILSDPRYRLGLKDVEPDFLGRAYEYLLRKFAESSGQSAGEFFTPLEVAWLMAHLINPKQGEEVYDPCCGSGGLLIKCQLVLCQTQKQIDKPLKLHGQELTGSTFAIAHMNMVLHDMEGEIVRGNTMTNPKFLEDSKLKKFDIVVTNPMWNQKSFDQSTFENDPYERFSDHGGFAPGSSADWAWLQHVIVSLKETGKGAVVIDTGAASRGSGNEGENKEKMIRKWFVDQDLVEAVILLPDNLFYNTTAAGLIMVLNHAKDVSRRGKVIFINASAQFSKGKPKNYLPGEGIKLIVEAFRNAQDSINLVKVATKEEIIVNDYNLSPARYVTNAATVEQRGIQPILDDLFKLSAQEKQLDTTLSEIFTRLGFRYGGKP
mgnify:CR=1 FL=1